jgi:uroporphyrinogen-III synthase
LIYIDEAMGHNEDQILSTKTTTTAMSAFSIQVAGLVLLLTVLFCEESNAFSIVVGSSCSPHDSGRRNGDVSNAWKRRHQPKGTTAMSAAAASVANDDKDQAAVWVALTREDGKNGKMVQALRERVVALQEIHVVEVPCIAHADGPDMKILADRLQEDGWDYIIVTSPEAARVVASAWTSAVVNNKDKNSPPVAAVGKATESTLKEHGINVVFTPSKATAETLAVELPVKASADGTNKVMYPASCKAQDTLQTGLSERGFDVVRLNTYDTVTAAWTDAQKVVAAKCKVACFASPSSVKGWLKNTDDNTSVLAACIGITSANACRKLGWKDENIFYPEYPGIEGWVDAVNDAVASLSLVHES